MDTDTTFGFPSVDCYTGTLLGINLPAVAPGSAAVVECARRLCCEASYSFVHALWWLSLTDGRRLVSVPPGAGPAVARALAQIDAHGGCLNPAAVRWLRAPVDEALVTAGLRPTARVIQDLCFACSGARLRRHHDGNCCRLTDGSVPPAEGLHLPAHCFPDGIVYGVIIDGRIASVAYAHRTGIMEGTVADIGVETAPAYRRRGYARTAVSAVVAHVAQQGGEARYACGAGNLASAATARSVGFVPYARSLILAAPSPMSSEAHPTAPPGAGGTRPD
ncbi:MAG: GNAT family N-acetyltransferase [Armatimonadetes bacterium]|nr:GNAT family N-acetyltransferase [Armatimonadota bacterium]